MFTKAFDKCWNVMLDIAMNIECYIRGFFLTIKWYRRGWRSGWTLVQIATEIEHEAHEVAYEMAEKYWMLTR